jgi:type I restriction enzyme S subunit
MERKLGYKQTEVGVIPEAWEVVSIGNLITEFRGGASLKPSDFTSTGVKVLPKGGVGRTGWLQIEDSDQKFCSPEYAAVNHRNQVDEAYTIVVLRDLVPSGPSIGLMVQIRGQGTFVLAQGVYGFKVNKSVIPGYLVQLSNTRWYRTLANSIMVGSTQVHITNTAFKRAQIPLPPFAEQEAIATALSDVDALLTALDTLIAKKRLIKQGAMQELLTGKKRLPGFSAEWEDKKLGDFTEIFKGNGLSKGKIVENGKRKCILYGELFTSYKRIITEVLRSTDAEDGVLSMKGDVLMPGSTTTTGIDLAIASALMLPDVALGGDVNIIRGKKKSQYSPEFLANYITYVSRNSVAEIAQGITIYHLYGKDLKRLFVKLPKIEEQLAITEILSDLDAEIAALEQKREKTRLLKQGMMQELLTGRIRLM